MKLFVDSKALFKYQKKIKKLFAGDGNLSIVCRTERKSDFYRANRIIKKAFKVYPSYILKDRHLSKRIFSFNNNGLIDIEELVVNEELSNKKKDLMLNSIKTLKINDTSGSMENYIFFRDSKHFVYETAYESNISEAVSFELGYFNKTSFSCYYSSCLGNTLYLDKNGNFHFCILKPDDSLLKNINDCNDIDSIFDCPNFIDILDKAIEKRKECKSKCSCFSKCNGGCPLVDMKCDAFISSINKANKRRTELKDKETSLSDLPLYVKESILKEISKFPK